MALSPDNNEFEHRAREMKEKADEMVRYAKENQDYIEKFVHWISSIREANHFEQGIYDTMTATRDHNEGS